MAALDPRTPVLVGIGAITERNGDNDPIDLMVAAIEAAAADCGQPSVVARADLVAVPRGTWEHADPGRLLATRLGAPDARSLLADVGILQTTLMARACRALGAGAEVVVVAGGEAAASARRAGKQTAPKPGTGTTDDATPDEVLSPHGMIISPLEIGRGFWTPAHQYALIERALGRTASELDAWWSSWSDIAAGNPHAWRPESVGADSLVCGSATNPAISYPYGRRHCSQMNVDQAAALVFTTVATATALGIPRDRWVFPHAVVESNHMVPVPARADLARSPGFAAVADALTAATGVAPADAALVDLYSCFPSAAEVQRREFGLDPVAAPTVTGGMSFAGGPFNNYVLQSTVRMAGLLRERPGDRGLVTAISGMISKQGGSMWSTEPPAAPCAIVDVSDRAAAQPTLTLVEADDEVASAGVVVSSTVVPDGEALRSWALVNLPDGRRTLVSTVDAEVGRVVIADASIGRAVAVAGQSFELA